MCLNRKRFPCAEFFFLFSQHLMAIRAAQLMERTKYSLDQKPVKYVWGWWGLMCFDCKHTSELQLNIKKKRKIHNKDQTSQLRRRTNNWTDGSDVSLSLSWHFSSQMRARGWRTEQLSLFMKGSGCGPWGPPEQQALSVLNGSENAGAETGSRLPDLWPGLQHKTVSGVAGRDISIFMATVHIYLSHKFLAEIWNKKSEWIYDTVDVVCELSGGKVCFNTPRTRMDARSGLLSRLFGPVQCQNKYSHVTMQQQVKHILSEVQVQVYSIVICPHQTWTCFLTPETPFNERDICSSNVATVLLHLYMYLYMCVYAYICVYVCIYMSTCV